MNIWVPKTESLENSDALLVPKHGVGGLFRITGRLPDGRQRVLAEWQKNLITDGGLNRWGTGAPIVNCSLGIGTTPPTVLDTNLVAFRRQQNSIINQTTGVITSSPYYQFLRWDFVFNPPGEELSIAEVGVGWGAGGASLWSRSLIKDVNGAPLILQWLPDETLTVTYEARLYPWLADVPHTTVISGVTYTGILRPSWLGGAGYNTFNNSALTIADVNSSNAYSGTIGVNTAGPSGTAATGVSTADAYLNEVLKGTGKVVWGPTSANFAGGVAAVVLMPRTQSGQVSFVPPIAKLNTHTLTINFDTGVWGRQP